jgi:hypothetical protein
MSDADRLMDSKRAEWLSFGINVCNKSKLFSQDGAKLFDFPNDSDIDYNFVQRKVSKYIHSVIFCDIESVTFNEETVSDFINVQSNVLYIIEYIKLTYDSTFLFIFLVICEMIHNKHKAVFKAAKRKNDPDKEMKKAIKDSKKNDEARLNKNNSNSDYYNSDYYDDFDDDEKSEASKNNKDCDEEHLIRKRSSPPNDSSDFNVKQNKLLHSSSINSSISKSSNNSNNIENRLKYIILCIITYLLLN